MTLHRERVHPTAVDGCYGCKISGTRWGGLARLRADNEGHYTQAELARDIYAGAKESGNDIIQVRGRRRPHQVMREGSWVAT